MTVTLPEARGTEARRAPSRPMRAAVLGAGWVSREVWIPLLSAHPRFEVAAVVDEDPAALRSAAQNVPACEFVRDYRDVDPRGLDVAIVALPNHMHLPAAQRLLEHGVPVFVEKPVCRTLWEAQCLALAGTPRDRTSPVLVHAWSAARHRADVRALAAVLPGLGRIRTVRLSWIRAGGVPTSKGWFTDRRLAGGGALLDLGWHLLDVGLNLLGWPPPARAAGTLYTDWIGGAEAASDWRGHGAEADTGPGPQREAEADTAVEDTARGFLVTRDGVGVWLETSWASHQPEDVTTIVVEGTEGQATLRCTFGFSPHRVPASSLTVLRRGRAERIPIPADPVGAEYRRQVDELARRLSGQDAAAPGELGPVSMAEVFVLASYVEQFYRSAEKWSTS
ncbi:MAG TPA: Gfo/Idh/MocA family oxidoreductase [Actinospica sp.]|nr:Gfo/Idh/MocA family oxidoreductase [Actinospica sp.]